MLNPLQITFHDLTSDPKIEALIQTKFEKLKAISPGITKCHVILEKHSKHHHKANKACARLDIKVPKFDDIVVTEYCREEFLSLQTAVIGVFKRGLVLLREESKRRQDQKRTPLKKGLATPPPPEAEETEEETYEA